jgi:hypothetical protein
MNKSIWIILGIFSILAGISLILATPDRLAALPPDQHPKLIQGLVFLVGTCGIIALACFFPKSHPVTLRILGAYGVFACIFNLVEGIRQHNFSQFPMVLVFWLPGSIYLVVKGKMTTTQRHR